MEFIQKETRVKEKLFNNFLGKIDTIKIPDKTKDKVRLLHDKGWPSVKIQKRFKKYTVRQIGAVRGWMKRGKY